MNTYGIFVYVNNYVDNKKIQKKKKNEIQFWMSQQGKPNYFPKRDEV